MKAPFLGHVVDGVCTHKDMDLSCGCVTCTYCDVHMIECDNRKAGLSCTTPVTEVSITETLEKLVQSESWGPSIYENRAQFVGRIDDELARLVDLEERLLAAEDIVLVYPYGRHVRHTL